MPGIQTEKESAEPNLYLPQPATLTRVEPMTATDAFFEVRLDSGEPLQYQPGQFVEISVPGIGEAPISICSSPTQGGAFQMVIRSVGAVTKALHQKKAGDSVGIRGPFGTTFPMDSELKGKHLLFIGGGIGLVPLRSAIRYALDKRDDYGRLAILSGTRTASERLFVSELEALKRRDDVLLLETVDLGSPDWHGPVGRITQLFSMLRLDPGPWAAVVCGPPLMYQFVVRELRHLQVPNQNIYVSLERRMKCGVGKCGHCQINGLYVCQSGPVFRYKDLFDLPEAF